MGEYRHVSHTFLPVYDETSEILILGSFPSVKSREQGFYYGHPQNRFWRVLAALYSCEVPESIEGKKAILLANHIAVWDVIDSCDIIGSSDSSIKNVIPADIPWLLQQTRITRIFANGKTAENLYQRFAEQSTGKTAVVLPSTSPANAAYSLERLTECWKRELLSK